MTVAAQAVIRCPLYLSLTPRYLSGFDNNLAFRHFIGRFAYAHLPYSHLTFFEQPFLLSLHASLFPPIHHRSGLTGTPKNPNRKACFHLYCSYVAFATHSTHRVARPISKRSQGEALTPPYVRVSYTAVRQVSAFRSLHQNTFCPCL